jgi:hypothetical protein
MAVMIGRTKGWIWWLAGLLCAALFGSRAEAAAAKALYGVRPRPRPMPRIDEKSVTEAQKKKAGKLVDAWLSAESPGEPSAAEKKEIARLIVDFGSGNFATRKAASEEILKYGGKALPQLNAALKHKDAEVQQRATRAIAAIKSSAGNRQVAELRKMRSAAHVVIRARQGKLRSAAYKAKLQIAALEQQGKKDEVRKKREEIAEVNRKSAALTRLYGLAVGPSTVKPGPVMARYGIRCRVAPGAKLKAKAAPAPAPVEKK